MDATVRQLAKVGAQVAILDVNLDAAQALADEVGSIACGCDITDTASVQ